MKTQVAERPPAPALGIELRHLRYFLAVSDELHFGRAAERLHMAQPPLSQAIRKLEQELGVQLLQRTSRAVSRTQAGEAFDAEARKVLASFDLAIAEARRAGGSSAALRVGCLPSLPMERLLRFVGGVHRRHPESRVQIAHLPALEQVRRLRTGELDLGILHRSEDDDGIEQQPLLVDTEPLFPGEQLAAFLPRGHALAAKRPVCPADLRGESLITFHRGADPALHDRLLAQIQAAGYRFSSIREAGGAEVRDLVIAVAAGHGVAFGPVSLPAVGDADGMVVGAALDPPLRMPDTVVAWQTNPPRLPPSVLTMVRDVARTLRADGAVASDR